MRLPELNKNRLGTYRVTTRGGMPLSVYLPHNPRLTTEARAFLQSIAGQDCLTGLTNSHVFSVLANQAIRLSQRHNRLLALITVTMQGLEASAGSASVGEDGSLLRAAVAAIFPKLRPPDLMARMGNSTLVILLPETGYLEACALAETLRSSLSSMCLAPCSDPAQGHVVPVLMLSVAVPGENTRCLVDLIK